MVHRSDGSGTTFVFTDYLSKISPEWKAGPGSNTSIKWPTGVGQQGNEGVAGMVKQTQGAVGYVELIYALKNKMEYGSVQNAAGVYLKADLDTVTAAAAGAAKSMPADFRVSITNAPGKNAYPIASFTWLLIPSADPGRGKAHRPGELPEVDARGRPERLCGSRIRAAAQGSGCAGTQADRADSLIWPRRQPPLFHSAWFWRDG